MSAIEMCRFLFADSGDIYFTPGLLKLNFWQYLIYISKARGYEHVICFQSINANELEILCKTEQMAKIYAQHAPQGWFKKALDYKQEKINGSSWYVATQNNNDAGRTIANLILGEKKDQYVFAMSHRLFPRIIAEMTNWAECVDERNRSIFLLQAELDDRGNLDGIWPSNLFNTDLLQQINAQTSQMLYDRISNCAPVKVEKWDMFEKRQLERLVQRLFLVHSKVYQPKGHSSLHEELHQQLAKAENKVLFGRRVRNKQMVLQMLAQEDTFRQLLNNNTR